MAAISSVAATHGPIAIERALIFPGGPGDGGQLVGERDGRFLLAAAMNGGEQTGPNRSSDRPRRAAPIAALSTARAPSIKSVRRYTSPRLLMRPSRRRSPEEFSRAVSPSQLAAGGPSEALDFDDRGAQRNAEQADAGNTEQSV